jgi:putative FmdB family regulatory protein
MPLYEYQCDRCGEVFEVMQKFSDAPLQTHEKCGGAVQRLLSVPALQFKGSGWYITDYAKSGSSAPNGKPDAASSAGKPADNASSTKSGDSPSSASSSPTTSDKK